MRMMKHWFLAGLLLGAFASQATAQRLPEFTGLVKQVGPAVVSVEATRTAGARGNGEAEMPEGLPPEMEEFFRRFFGGPDRPRMPRDRTSAGSGFILSQDGYVITNYHVVREADEVVVRLSDNREFEAEIVGTDEATDIALLKLGADGLPSVDLGDSDVLQAGEWVLAIGSPFGLEHTVTAGIVSAKSRTLPNQQYIPFIQTDVPINRGNSGGPLINMDGQIVGVNSQIFSSTGGYMGLSFSIPTTVVENVVRQLKDDGKVRRGWLGVQIQGVNSELAKVLGLERARGALISDVMEGSPAEQGGLEPRDVILRFNGRDIEDWRHLPSVVGLVMPGSEVPVEIARDGKRRELEIVVGELPADEIEPAADDGNGDDDEGRLGIVVGDLTEQQREELGVEGGVVVERVVSRAARRAGLQRGDVIVSMGNEPVQNAAGFRQQAQELEPGVPVALLVRRGEGSLFVALAPQGAEQ